MTQLSQAILLRTSPDEARDHLHRHESVKAALLIWPVNPAWCVIHVSDPHHLEAIAKVASEAYITLTWERFYEEEVTLWRACSPQLRWPVSSHHEPQDPGAPPIYNPEDATHREEIEPLKALPLRPDVRTLRNALGLAEVKLAMSQEEAIAHALPHALLPCEPEHMEHRVAQEAPPALFWYDEDVPCSVSEEGRHLTLRLVNTGGAILSLSVEGHAGRANVPILETRLTTPHTHLARDGATLFGLLAPGLATLPPPSIARAREREASLEAWQELAFTLDVRASEPLTRVVLIASGLERFGETQRHHFDIQKLA